MAAVSGPGAADLTAAGRRRSSRVDQHSIDVLGPARARGSFAPRARGARRRVGAHPWPSTLACASRSTRFACDRGEKHSPVSLEAWPYAIRTVRRPRAEATRRRGHRHRRQARCASPTTCSTRCTTRPASAWPPRRSACRSGSSSTTSATGRARSSTRDHGVRGEWVYDEGCLSVPGLYVEIVRPKEVHLVGRRPRRQRGVDRGRRAARPGCSSTSSTTSTACCCSTASTTDQRKAAMTRAAAGARSKTSRRRPRHRPGLSRPLPAPCPHFPPSPSPRLPRHARRCRAAAAGARRRRPRHRARRDRRRQAPRPGGGDDAQPGEGRGARARPAGHRPVDDVLDAGAELGVVVAFGQLDQAARARRSADGQPPLLAAAALAGRGAGRAGDPRRRRPRPACA